MTPLNETHDLALRCWLDSANLAAGDFPIQNLPFAVFRVQGVREGYRAGVAIGDQVLDLAALSAKASFSGPAARALAAACQPSLNALMALGRPAWSALRLELSRGLRVGAQQRDLWQACLVPQATVEYSLPAQIGDYTDFYTSIHHATSVGRMFRPDNPLLPNYKWVPIGYHGRASSIGVSGQAFSRPHGQILPAGASEPVLAPSQRLDYELELGIFIGSGNALGDAIPLAHAGDHIFGLCLLNDWSARDLQAWEYQPLGPFLAKNFATTISPWIVTLEALAPYRAPWSHAEDDPSPLDYLDDASNRQGGAFDIQLEVLLETEAMRARGALPERLSLTSYRHAYWTAEQLLAHHTVNGCNLMPGDLLGTGTQSGPLPQEAGSLLELSRGGKQPVTLSNGEQRSFLADGDTVIMRGWCERPGAARLGFGQVAGRILPARG